MTINQFDLLLDGPVDTLRRHGLATQLGGVDATPAENANVRIRLPFPPGQLDLCIIKAAVAVHSLGGRAIRAEVFLT